MAKSMTGFGRGCYEDEKRIISVEIKSVNHRFSDITVKMPRRFSFAEEALKALVKKAVPRGKTDVSVNYESLTADDTSISLNEDLAKSYYNALANLKKMLPDLVGSVTMELITQMPDVIKSSPCKEDEEELLKGLLSAAGEAAAALDKMRRTEGEKLAKDILKRASLIETTVDDTELYAPLAEKEYAKKLRERIEILTADQSVIDEGRIALEAAIFADKANITEELVRLKSHIYQLRSILAAEDEAAGKKLDFLAQEMNREANTIGSKACDIRITNNVLSLKAEIEKIREQVQNLE